MQAVMQVCREECFLPDAILFEEGQPAKEIFVLVEGKVEESFTINEAKLCLLHPVGVGEIIGCPALSKIAAGRPEHHLHLLGLRRP